MTTLKELSTMKYLGSFIVMFGISIVLEFTGEFLWVNYQVSSFPQEYVSGALGWTAVIGIFALVPISPFRPYNRFSLRGDCQQRAMAFGLSVLTAFAIFVGTVLAVASAI